MESPYSDLGRFLGTLPGSRLGCSEEEYQTLDLIKNLMDQIGAGSAFQVFETEAYKVQEYYLRIHQGDSIESITCLPIGFCRSDSSSVVSGEVVQLENGVDLEHQYRGKIVLCSRADRVRHLGDFSSSGPIGCIETSGIPRGIRSSQLKGADKIKSGIPGVSISECDSTKLRRGDGQYVSLCSRQVVGKYKSRNLIVSIPAAIPTQEEVVIGAHADSVYGAEGACDNASGIAVLAELAKGLLGYRLKYNLSLVWFGCEEYGWIGSRYFLEQHRRPDGIRMMVNLDSLGCRDTPLEIKVTKNAAEPQDLFTLCKSLTEDVSVTDSRGSGDDLTFSEREISTVCFYQATPFLHTTCDTLSTLSLAALHKSYKQIQDFILKYST